MTEKRKNAIAKMNELKGEADKIVKEFSDSIDNNDLKSASESKSKLKDLQGEYANAANIAAYEEIIELGENKAGKIFIEMVKMLEIEYLNAKFSEDKETKTETVEIEYRNRRINPIDVEKHYGSVIGAEKGWEHEIDRFGFRLALRVAKMIGMSDADLAKVSDSYSMNKLNEQHRKSITEKVNKEGNAIENPISNTAMIKEMQRVVDMCLGTGYKVTSHDVNFMLLSFTNLDPKNPRMLKTAALKKTADIFMNVMSNLLLFSDKKHSGYAIDYKVKKEKNGKKASSEDNKPFTPTGNTAKTEKPEPKEPEIKLEVKEKPARKSASSKKQSTPKEENPAK